jgi:hypothetical protein
VPALFLLSTVFLLTNALVDPTERWWTLGIFAVIGLGVPVYYLTVGKRAIGQVSAGRAGDR